MNHNSNAITEISFDGKWLIATDTREIFSVPLIQAWRDAPPYEEMKPPGDDFVQLFQSEWNQLPQAESLIVVREIVRVSVEQPEQPMTASYADGAVEITSWRANVFFQILHILRHLDPKLAEPLIAEHAQLAHAARRFPKGRESMEEEAESRRRARPSTDAGGHTMMGSPEDFPYLESLHRSSLDGDFGPPFDHGLEKYRRDSNPKDPNLAPRELCLRPLPIGVFCTTRENGLGKTRALTWSVCQITTATVCTHRACRRADRTTAFP